MVMTQFQTVLSESTESNQVLGVTLFTILDLSLQYFREP